LSCQLNPFIDSYPPICHLFPKYEKLKARALARSQSTSSTLAKERASRESALLLAEQLSTKASREEALRSQKIIIARAAAQEKLQKELKAEEERRKISEERQKREELEKSLGEKRRDKDREDWRKEIRVRGILDRVESGNGNKRKKKGGSGSSKKVSYEEDAGEVAWEG